MLQYAYVSDRELITRILSKEWVYAGVLSNAAFTLRPGETYISVNRPSVSTYNSDVSDFIKKHPSFSLDVNCTKYRRAALRVAEVRSIRVNEEIDPYRVDVEIEPRDLFTKTHAGIFTRLGNRNIKAGDTLSVMD